MRVTRWAAAGVLATSTLLSGCGSSEGPAARDAAVQLLRAVEDRDGRAACDLLSPAARSELSQSSGRPCEQAILSEDVGEEAEVGAVQVFDTMAQVRLTSGAVFLSRFDGHWLVTAAACDPVPDRPYDCSVQGG